jgi:hypothetical protein
MLQKESDIQSKRKETCQAERMQHHCKGPEAGTASIAMLRSSRKPL